MGPHSVGKHKVFWEAPPVPLACVVQQFAYLSLHFVCLYSDYTLLLNTDITPLASGYHSQMFQRAQTAAGLVICT